MPAVFLAQFVVGTGAMRLSAECVGWLMALQWRWSGVVAPDLGMDTPTAVSLAPGECRAYRIAVSLRPPLSFSSPSPLSVGVGARACFFDFFPESRSWSR